jgi:hypothetical protein
MYNEQCIADNFALQLELHLQQTLPLLCLEPYKHPKITKLNLNTTKEKGNGNKLPLPFSLEHHLRRRLRRVVVPSSFS